MNEINSLIEMLEKGGFRSARDWFCLKMDTSHMRHLSEVMKEADSAISDPEQKKRFEQGIPAIQMRLDGKDKPGSESEAGKVSMLVN